jgi:pyocin large subunit-like protein
MTRYSSHRRKAVPTTLAGVLAVIIGLIVNHYRTPATPPKTTSPTVKQTMPSEPRTSAPQVTPSTAKTSKVGWTSRASLESHFRKHANEFGNITMDEYLVQAKELRDAAVDGSVLEIVRKDGVITRFDKSSGSFLAFNRAKTIRTFFRPDDGERYFRRQAERVDQVDD